MATNNMSVTIEFYPDVNEAPQLVSDETLSTISKILLCILNPCIGVIGVTGSILSILVICRHGLHKCSNILLVSLAFMDMGYLFFYNSVPHILYLIEGGGKFLYSNTVSRVLYVFYFLFVVPDYAFCFWGLCIPMLITIERLVAVYIPLKFGQIITPFRTWSAVLSIGIFWFIFITYTCFWYKFEYVFDEELNRSVGIISKSELFYRDLKAIPIFEEMLFSMKIPPLVTVVGCVAIIVKVKASSLKRRKMTSSSSKQASTSRTTRTLLAVSFTYLFTCTIVAVPSYLPEELAAYSLTTENPSNAGVIIYQFANIMPCLNSSWNFLLYVVMNKNFRDTFKELVTPSTNFCRKV